MPPFIYCIWDVDVDVYVEKEKNPILGGSFKHISVRKILDFTQLIQKLKKKINKIFIFKHKKIDLDQIRIFLKLKHVIGTHEQITNKREKQGM